MVDERNVKSVYMAAAEIPAEQRGEFLDSATTGDPALRKRVEALLKVRDEPGSFLSRPAVRFAEGEDTPSSESLAEGVGSVIGPYTLLEQVGEGGMGVVFMAEQSRPVQRIVAIKIIKPGMDSREVIARLEAERQALALMDHPNIAKVLDAGTTEAGRPYFVMELVGGIPITKFCDDHYLTLRQRLELFIPVCTAVQHAHQKGIIHRDLKPSNVLVVLYDGRPIPKVIDFGVAKAIGQQLTERTMFTQLGQIVGTLEYMSPEQAELNQGNIDTRSDIYSLGVLLYELLTGTTPFESKRLHEAAFDEILRIIREDDPPRPSSRLSSIAELPSIAANRHIEPRKLTLLLREDLDWIVMKTMEKERARRYETASSLAQDIERYLTDQAVQACPPSRIYRFRKFARRNKVLLSTAAIVAAALVVGACVSTWQAVRASRAEAAAMSDLANSYLNQARAISSSRRPGQRFQALDAVRKSQEITGPSRPLADAAVAALCLPDMVVSREWAGYPRGSESLAFDPALTTYARCESERVSIRSVDGDHEIASLAIGAVEPYYGLIFSANGRYLHIRRLAPDQNSLLYEVSPHGAKLLLSDEHKGFAFSPSSVSFATTYPNGSLRILNLPDCREVKQFDIPSQPAILEIAWNPRYNRLLLGYRNEHPSVLELDSGTIKPLTSVPQGWLTWHPDGRSFAVNFENSVRIYDAATFEPASRDLTLSAAKGGVSWFSRRGDLLVTNDWWRDRRLWDPDGGTELMSVPANDSPIGSVFSPDDREMAASTLGDKIQTWRIHSGAEEKVILPQSGRYGNHVVTSPDGRWLAVNAVDSLSIIDAARGCEIANLPTGPWTFPLGVDGSGKLRLFIGASLQALPVTWNGERNELVIGDFEPLLTLATGNAGGQSLDGAVVARAEYQHVRIVKADANAGMAEDPSGSFDFRYCDVSPNGELIAAGSHWSAQGARGNACVWNSQSGKLLTELPVGAVCSIRFSATGKWLATASFEDHACQLWRVTTWEAGPRFDSDVSPAFSPDDTMLAFRGLHGQIELSEASTGQSFATLTSRELTELTPQCFSPDGTRLYALAQSGSLHVWNLPKIRAELHEMCLDQGWPPMPNPADSDQLPPRIRVIRASQNGSKQLPATDGTADDHGALSEPTRAEPADGNRK